MNELKIKTERVRKFLKEKKLKAVLLSSQANFSWITCGGDSHVVMGADSGVASVLVTQDKNYIVTNNIEVGRIKDEELQNLKKDFKFAIYPWYEEEKKLKVIKDICPIEKLGSDSFFNGAKQIAGDFKKLRFTLTPEEIKRYEFLGKVCGEIMGRVCCSIRKGETENKIAARLSEEVLAKGIQPNVLLVAADDRIKKYRHPIPTEKKINKYVMVVLCGKKWGLIANLTRIVHFGKLSQELKKRHAGVARIDSAFISCTRPGTNVSKIFKCALESYKDTGFANEWKLHHQGGSTGYEGRDYKGTQLTKEIVQENQAFAWNPSITGTKTEDTIIAFSNKTKIITATPKWPVIKIKCCGSEIERPDILIK